MTFHFYLCIFHYCNPSNYCLSFWYNSSKTLFLSKHSFQSKEGQTYLKRLPGGIIMWAGQKEWLLLKINIYFALKETTDILASILWEVAILKDNTFVTVRLLQFKKKKLSCIYDIKCYTFNFSEIRMYTIEEHSIRDLLSKPVCKVRIICYQK